MTISGMSTPGEGSGARGLCEPHQSPQRWTQGVTVPVECFRVEVVVHRQPGTNVYGYSMEITDPHSRELLAKVAEPARNALATVGLVSNVTLDMRGILLELTDPDPF